jgi:hypothetical protein
MLKAAYYLYLIEIQVATKVAVPTASLPGSPGTFPSCSSWAYSGAYEPEWWQNGSTLDLPNLNSLGIQLLSAFGESF